MRPPLVGFAIGFAIRFALVAALLLTWALGIGRYGGPDEPAHVLRSFAAAHGDVLGDPADPLPAGYRVVSVPATLASGDPSCYRHDARLTSSCAAPDPSTGDDGEVRVATSAGLTPPLYHLAVGLVVRVVGDPADTAWYRAVAALLHAVVLAATLTRLRHRPQAAVLTVAIISPAAWFLFGVVNPNSLEIALALLGWVGVGRALERDVLARADAWWIALPMAAAILIRPIAVVPAVAMIATLQLRGRLTRHRSVVAVPLTLAVVGSIGWNLAVDVQVDDPRTAVHRSVLANVGDALGSLHITAREAVDSLGWNEFRAPPTTLVLWATVWLAMVAWVVTASVATTRADDARHRIAWRAPAAWLLLMIATPVLFEVALAASVGPIWQGRYSLPMLVGLPVFTCRAGVRSTISATRTATVTAAVAAVAVAIEVITYWATVRRYAVGSDGSWWLDHAVRSTAWLGPRAWLGLHITVVTGCGALAIVAARRSSARTDQTM